MANAATVTGWIAWAALRGDTVADDAASSQALQRAKDYIEYTYIAQLLPAYDDTLSVVEPATYIAAKLELASPGFFSKTFTPDQRKILTGVDGIKWTPVGGKDSGSLDSMPRSSMIEAMFEPYISDDSDDAPMALAFGGT